MEIKSILNCQVSHKTFGEGIITNIDDQSNAFSVSFKNKELKFLFPIAFDGGKYLTFSDEQLQNEVQNCCVNVQLKAKEDAEKKALEKAKEEQAKKDAEKAKRAGNSNGSTNNNKKLKNVLCLATGDTYGLVVKTKVTAHPAVSPYPLKETDYLIPIKAGGILETVYSIQSVVDVIPNRIDELKTQLSESDYKAILDYHTERMRFYGYGKKETPYRFYLLKKQADIKQPFERKYIQICTYLNYSDLPVIK